MCVGDNESEDGVADLIGKVKMSDHLSVEARSTDFSMGFLLPSSNEMLCFQKIYDLATLPIVQFRVTKPLKTEWRKIIISMDFLVFVCATGAGSRGGNHVYSPRLIAVFVGHS